MAPRLSKLLTGAAAAAVFFSGQQEFSLAKRLSKEQYENLLEERKDDLKLTDADINALPKDQKKEIRQLKSDIRQYEKKNKVGGMGGMGGGGGIPGMEGLEGLGGEGGMPDFSEMLKDPKKMEEMMKMFKGMGLGGDKDGEGGGMDGLGDLLKNLGNLGGAGGDEEAAAAPPGDDEL